MDKIFEQLTSAPLNETGPVRLWTQEKTKTEHYITFLTLVVHESWSGFKNYFIY